MKIIGILLIWVGLLGILMGCMMFGDIGLACLVGAITALLSGILKCRECGSYMRPKQGRLLKNGERAWSYVCTKKDK